MREQVDSVLQGGERGELTMWRNHGHRVRVEGQNDHLTRTTRRHVPAARKGLMAHVNTIEISDSHHGGPPTMHLGVLTEDVHLQLIM